MHTKDGDTRVPSCDIATLRTTISKEKDVDCILDWFCAYTGGKYAVYHLAHHKGVAADSPYVRTNYPAKWVRRYLLQNYVDIDPVVVRGFSSAFPFFWDQLEIASDKEVEFFLEAQQYGVGQSGVSIPLCDKLNRRALFSISSDLDPDHWRSRINPVLEDLTDCANYLHQKVIGEEFGSETERPLLSPREIECMSWIASGKFAGDVSIILGISEHTVRDYLKSARTKLGCVTMSQAVRVATELGILEQYDRQPLKI